MNQDLSIFQLVLEASLVVQLVMAGLLLTSLASWTVIFGLTFATFLTLVVVPVQLYRVEAKKVRRAERRTLAA